MEHVKHNLVSTSEPALGCPPKRPSSDSDRGPPPSRPKSTVSHEVPTCVSEAKHAHSSCSTKQVQTVPTAIKLRYMFLGAQTCYRAWFKLTGVGCKLVFRTVTRVKLGEKDHFRKTRASRRWQQESMHGAILALVRHCQERMPLRRTNPEHVIMPMSHQVQLFEMMRLWYDVSRSKGGTPLLPRPPKYSTFRMLMRSSGLQHIKFHRVVEMGRCPTCSWLTWKCMSCGPEARQFWSDKAARHRFLQLQQKAYYAKLRAEAAVGFPHVEVLYVAMDCSSGHEFRLPHVSAHDTELPSKALKDFNSLPFKVANILVHGDTRAHVLLSPASVQGVRSDAIISSHGSYNGNMFACAYACTRAGSHHHI